MKLLIKLAVVAIFLMIGCGVDNKDRARKTLIKSQQRLSRLQKQCDGKVIYDIRVNHCFWIWCEVDTVYFADFKCVPDGITVELK